MGKIARRPPRLGFGLYVGGKGMSKAFGNAKSKYGFKGAEARTRLAREVQGNRRKIRQAGYSAHGRRGSVAGLADSYDKLKKGRGAPSLLDLARAKWSARIRPAGEAGRRVKSTRAKGKPYATSFSRSAATKKAWATRKKLYGNSGRGKSGGSRRRKR